MEERRHTVAASALAIATASPLPEGTLNAAYTATLVATGGTPPYAWSSSGGSLPGGLALNGAGVVSGTPSDYGTFNFTVRAADNGGLTAAKTFSLYIPVLPLAITTLSPLVSGQQGSAYAQALTGAGGIAPYTWSLVSGSLPTGLSLDSLGNIAGTPTALGTFTFAVKLTDNRGTNVTKTLAVTITTATVTMTTSTLPDSTVGAAYSQTLAASGGTAPYSWSITWQSLPPGLILSDAGLINGTPTNAGTFSFIVQVTDALRATAATLFTIQIAHSQPILSVQGIIGGAVGLRVFGDSGPNYTIEVSSNLVDWTSVFTTNAPAMPFDWTDSAAGGEPARFYRAWLEP